MPETVWVAGARQPSPSVSFRGHGHRPIRRAHAEGRSNREVHKVVGDGPNRGRPVIGGHEAALGDGVGSAPRGHAVCAHRPSFELGGALRGHARPRSLGGIAPRSELVCPDRERDRPLRSGDSGPQTNVRDASNDGGNPRPQAREALYSDSRQMVVPSGSGSNTRYPPEVTSTRLPPGSYTYR